MLNKKQILTLAILLSFISAGFSAVGPSTDDVVLLIEMTRHGSRAPQEPLGPKADWVKQFGKGELTHTGMKQRFYLGQQIKAKYPGLFNQTMKPDEYFIYSTNVNRTIASAVSHFYGLQNQFSTDSF
jgi:hypothetical protein